MTINELCKAAFHGSKDKGFWDKERNIGELLMLITSELSEALDAHRENRWAKGYDIQMMRDMDVFDGEPDQYSVSAGFKEDFEKNVKDTFEDEIADAFIRLADLCGGLNIDIEAHIACKMAYNKTRERLHGKAY